MANDTEDKDVESKKDKSKPKRPLRSKFIRYGAIAGVLGTLFAALQPWAMEKAISSQIKVDPTSPGYMFWEHVPLPIITKFHLFNIENPGEFLKGGKLRVRELGPFTLKQDRWKEVIEFTEKTVKYYEWRNYTIAEELSVGSWDQEITVLNPMVASIGSIVGDKLEQLIPIPLAVSPFVYSTVSALLLVHSQNFFLKTTPRNVIVGQRINLLDTVTTLVKPLELLGVKASDLIPTDDLPNNTFGLINGKNYTRMGPWEVYTGVDVPKELYTNAVAFKNEKLMKRWAGPECNTPRGTDGIQFQPLINRTTKLTIFSGDIYRSLDLIYAEDYDYMGIQTYKYILDPAIFQPPSVNPDNACYCVHTGKKKARCEYEGILDLTGGFSGSPFVVTKPHFLEAPEVQKLVDGLSPDPEKHTFYLLIKPDIGVPISAKGRLQFNLRVEKVPFLRGFNNIRDTIIPLGWIEEGGSIDGVLYYLMRGGLVIAPMAASAGFYGAAIGGWAAFLAGLIYTVFRKSGKGKVDNMEKLFEPRESPTKKELMGDSKKMKSQSKLSMNQSDQQSPMNGVLVPVDYVQPSSSVIQFYRLPPGVNQGGGQFDQLLLTIPNANQEMNSPGTVPKITWNGRGSQSVKERTGKVRDKMSRGQSLPRERASQRSKRIQVNSKETQDRFVQVDRDTKGFRFAGKDDIIKSQSVPPVDASMDNSIENEEHRAKMSQDNTYENVEENNFNSNHDELSSEANLKTANNEGNLETENTEINSEGIYEEVDDETVTESGNLYDSTNEPQSPQTEPILQSVSANLFASSSHISRSLIDMVITGNKQTDVENDEKNNHDGNTNINKQTRPSLSEAAERSVSATLPGEYISGNQKTLVDENNNIRLAKSKSGPRSSYSAVSRYQSIDPGEPYDDGDETMLFQRDSTTESEATTPQSDDTDDKQEVKSYQKEGVNDLPGVETPERLATPSFSDEFSIGSDTSRASTAKSLIEPKTNKKETKQNSSCIVS